MYAIRFARFALMGALISCGAPQPKTVWIVVPVDGDTDTDMDGDTDTDMDGDTDTDTDTDTDSDTDSDADGDTDTDSDADGDTDTDTDTIPVFDVDGDGFEAHTDCDDGDASVFPGAPEACDGADSDCDGYDDSADLTAEPAGCSLFSADADGDGFLTEPVCRCGASPEYPIPDTGTTHRDCYDANPDANEDNYTSSEVDRGDGSWDWNCDGVESPSYAYEPVCRPWLDGTCLEVQPGIGPAEPVPACGAPFDLYHCDLYTCTTAATSTEVAVQRCR